MARKLRVGVLFGGRSGEHEVSLLSAASILKAIDRSKFDVVPIGITKEGHWLAAGEATNLLEGDSSSAVARRLRAGDPEATPGAKLLHEGIPTLFAPEPAEGALVVSGKQGLDGQSSLDLVFPVLHGTFGEDGTIQGLFELAGIAYVGSGVLGSSAGMDKDVMKRLFAQAGLPIVKHLTLLRADWETSPRKAVARVEAALKYPVFVKPANLGSSVGISNWVRRLTWPPGTTASWLSNRASEARKARPANSRWQCSATTIPRRAWWVRSSPARSSTTTRPSIFRRALCLSFQPD
jgi:D-alanine-D-alanine ligase